MTKSERPALCRNRLRDEGKAYPKSGCEACNGGPFNPCPYEPATMAADPTTVTLKVAASTLEGTYAMAGGLARDRLLTVEDFNAMPSGGTRTVTRAGVTILLPSDEVVDWLCAKIKGSL